METRSNALFVGTIVIILTFSLIAFMAWIGQHNWSKSKSFYTIYFETSVTGLLEGSAVEYQGVHIGVVDEIALETTPIDRVRVTVSVNPSIVIKQGTLASLQLQGLTGNRVIRLKAPRQPSIALKTPPGEPYPVIQSIRAPFDDAIEQLPEMLKKVSDAAQAVSTFMRDENQQRFSRILEHVEHVSAKAPEAINTMDQFFANAEQTLIKIEKAFKTVEDTAVHVAQTTQSFQAWLDENKRPISHLIKEGSIQLGTVLKESAELLKKWNQITDEFHHHPLRLLTGTSIPEYKLNP